MARTSPTTWIPTTTAAVTRNAEYSSIDLWNNNMLNKDNFTLYVEGYLYDQQTNLASIGLQDTNINGSNAANHLSIFRGSAGFYRVATAFTIVGTDLSNNSTYKMAIQRNGTSVKWFRNGAQLGTTQTIPVFDYRYLMIQSDSTFATDKILLFNRTLSDSECIDITS